MLGLWKEKILAISFKLSFAAGNVGMTSGCLALTPALSHQNGLGGKNPEDVKVETRKSVDHRFAFIMQ